MIKTIRRGQVVPSIGIKGGGSIQIVRKTTQVEKDDWSLQKVCCILQSRWIFNRKPQRRYTAYLKEKGNSSIELIG